MQEKRSDVKVTLVMTIFISTGVLAFFGCAPQFSKVPESSVDQAARTSAEQSAISILSSYEKGDYKLLGDEATDEVRLGLTIEKQKDAHASVKNVYGAFQSLEYAETWADPVNKLSIYRFKGKYSVSDKVPEVRVVFNSEGKLAGFWLKPWADSLQ